MAISLQCPRCMHEQKIDDDKADKEVPCKICHNLLTPGKAAAKPDAKAAAKKASPAGVKAGMPSAQAGRKPSQDDDDDATPRKKGKDPDERRPSPARIRTEDSGGSGVLMYVVLAGGAFLAVAVLCGGGGLAAYLLLSPGEDRVEQVAQNNENVPAPPQGNLGFNDPINPPPIQPPIIEPPIIKQPRPNLPIVPPPRPVFDPANPNDAGRVLDALKGPANQRGDAFRWLKEADPNHQRRADVGTALDGLVSDYLQAPSTFGNNDLFNAYFRWVTKDNVPMLTQVVEKTRFTVWDNTYRHNAMKTLGKFKDPRGADALAKKLGNAFDGGIAVDALIDMGPGAEKLLLTYHNHPDGRARDEARRVLNAYKTKNDAIMNQCIADLAGNDNNRRGVALQWIAAAEVDPQRKADVSKVLNGMIENEGSLRNRDLVTALEKYGSKENAARLIQILDQAKLGSHETIRVLAKIRDPDGVKAIARQVGNFFNGGEAKKALKECGPLAEPAVIEAMYTTKDNRARVDYVRFLGEIGTRQMSLPALQKVGFAFQKDRQLIPVVQQSMQAIVARGK